MATYDPEKGPQPGKWLAMDESERVAAVESYHRHHRIQLPRATLHATIHLVVENQVALGEGVVVETLARLRSEGLTRHEAVHAIGTVLAEQIFHALKSGSGAQLDMSKSYLERVRRLTADEWRQSGETET
jgi:hypothetical protein